MCIFKKKKQSKVPYVITFVSGALLGTVAGLLLAQKSGNELIKDAKGNIVSLKEKAKKLYDKKEEIIEDIDDNIQEIKETIEENVEL